MERSADTQETATTRLLASLNEEGMTIIYVTHDPRMSEFAQRLIHIQDGKIWNGAPGNSTDVSVDTTSSHLQTPKASGNP